MSTAVIIINWKRPRNIGRIIRTANAALPDATIFVLDHGEGDDGLAGRVDVPFDLCWIRRQANVGPAVRFKLAAQWPFDHYLCIDDDTFLTVEQIRSLMDKLRREPDRAHGITGQVIYRFAGGEHALRGGIRGNAEATVINQVYAFTRRRAQAALQLAAKVGYERWEDVKRTDDVLLSCAGPGFCRIHDLGPIEECPTGSAADIATFRSAGFYEERHKLLEKIFGAGLPLFIAEVSAADRPFPPVAAGSGTLDLGRIATLNSTWEQDVAVRFGLMHLAFASGGGVELLAIGSYPANDLSGAIYRQAVLLREVMDFISLAC